MRVVVSQFEGIDTTPAFSRKLSMLVAFKFPGSFRPGIRFRRAHDLRQVGALQTTKRLRRSHRCHFVDIASDDTTRLCAIVA